MFWHVWVFFLLLLFSCHLQVPSFKSVQPQRSAVNKRTWKGEKESRRKSPERKGSSNWSQILPAERLCVLLSHELAAFSLGLVVFLVQNSPIWAWLEPPPHLLPPWKTREHRVAQRSPFFPPQNTAAKRKPDLQTATVFLQQTCDSFWWLLIHTHTRVRSLQQCSFMNGCVVKDRLRQHIELQGVNLHSWLLGDIHSSAPIRGHPSPLASLYLASAQKLTLTQSHLCFTQRWGAEYVCLKVRDSVCPPPGGVRWKWRPMGQARRVIVI